MLRALRPISSLLLRRMTDRQFPDRIFWLDAEMTGLDVLGHDTLMELACVVTDGELNVVVEGPELVFGVSNRQLKKMGAWCRKTHGESGLTKKCRFVFAFLKKFDNRSKGESFDARRRGRNSIRIYQKTLPESTSSRQLGACRSSIYVQGAAKVGQRASL